MRFFKVLMCCCLLGLGLSGCQNNDKVLRIMFAPTKNPESILNGFGPAKEVILNELNQRGFDFTSVEFSVGDNYEIVGEALASGTADVGFIPSGTYVKFQDEGVKLLLTAQHPQVSISSNDPSDWNANKPTTIVNEPTTIYQGIIVTSNTQKGQELAQKVNNQENLSWEDLNTASWCVGNPTSASGNLYPSMWLDQNYGHKISELEHQVPITGYGDTINSMQSGVCDIGVGYADFRIDYQQSWPTIWDDTNVIGVTDYIPYDTISVSQHSSKMSDELANALQDIFLHINENPQGLEAIKSFNVIGYGLPDLHVYEEEKKVIESQAN